MKIQGSVVVVTGASSGIGRATALAFAKRGARVVVAARRLERLRDLEALIRSKDGEALAVECDVTSAEQVRELASLVEERFGRCDVLVNNAGVSGGGRFEDVSWEHLDRVVKTNLLGVVYGVKAFLPLMRAGSGGHIVNVASLAAEHRAPGLAIYTATKAGVLALSECLNLEMNHSKIPAFSESLDHEVSSRGVRVTAVNPGLVRTEGFPQSEMPRMVVMPSERVARAIVHVVERGKAPVLSVPRWMGGLEVFRILLPGPYRWAASRIVLTRRR